ncbi:hypothetical protein ABZ370_35285 [Streptomyces sp. NPDC005962]|uniref:hypothetical protein n=1 Tax=Streptomyces sp. NPDC005962 TaxID=3154466 RepID=UPI0033CA75D8
MDDIDAALCSDEINLHYQTIDLNVMKLALNSNIPNHPAGDYFIRSQPSGSVDYRVDCIEVDSANIPPEELNALSDRTYHGTQFRTGYGLFGRRLEKVVLPFAVKHLLTVHSAETDAVHLKAAGFVDHTGGTGKSVFLAQACRSGISNASPPPAISNASPPPASACRPRCGTWRHTAVSS